MILTAERQCTAFEGIRLFARGSETEVREAVRKAREERETNQILAFYDDSGENFDPDYPAARASAETAADPGPEAARKPGRPRLGVVGREVTLLPRHWEWLESQPGGSSVALRKLVEKAKRESAPEDRVRRSIETTYRFMAVMCGHAAGFEELSRALFRRDWEHFDELGNQFPRDIANHVHTLSLPARPEHIEP